MELDQYPESDQEISDTPAENETESGKKGKKKISKTVITVLLVIIFIAAVVIYVVITSEDDTPRIISAAEDAAKEFSNGEFQSYLDEIIEKCGLNDLTAEFTVDYDSIQKLTLSIDFKVNVSFFSDEIDDYYCENDSADKAEIEKLRSIMQSFSRQAGELDNKTFEFTIPSEDYIRLHLNVDYNTITTSDGREYYYTDTFSLEKLTVDGTEILCSEYPAP